MAFSTRTRINVMERTNSELIAQILCERRHTLSAHRGSLRQHAKINKIACSANARTEPEPEKREKKPKRNQNYFVFNSATMNPCTKCVIIWPSSWLSCVCRLGHVLRFSRLDNRKEKKNKRRQLLSTSRTTHFVAMAADVAGKGRKITVTTRTPMNIRIRLWAHSFATCYDFRSELLCISLSELLQPLQSAGPPVDRLFCHSTLRCDKFARDFLLNNGKNANVNLFTWSFGFQVR